MPLYVGDYIKKTSRLTVEGHGAYLLLIMDYWVTGKPLPDDDSQLSAITKSDRKTWKKLRPILEQFFIASDGVWRHERIDEELANAQEITSERSEAGRRGAEKRWQKHKQNDGSAIGKQDSKAMAEPMPESMANRWQNDAQSQSQSQIDEEEKESPSSSQDAAREKPPLVLPEQIAVIRAFDAAIVKHWGAAQARPNPAATDCVTAQSYLQAGADLDLLGYVFDTQCQKMAHGKKQPPGTLKYFERTVLEVISEGKRPPLQTAQTKDEGRYFGPDGQWRKRVESFLESGFWRDAWGAKPGLPGSVVPAQVAAEFAEKLNLETAT